MHNTEEKTSEIYEHIAVVVIYLPDMAEILFEKERELLIGEYCEIFQQCLEIMEQEKTYRDFIIHSTYICGIFHNRMSGECQGAVNAAGRILENFQKMNRKRDKSGEKICFGIGAAAGSGGRIVLQKVGNRAGAIWIGKVLEDARALAQMAWCDGLVRIRIADGMFGEVFGG